MSDQSLSLSEVHGTVGTPADEASLTEVERSALQAVSGGYTPLPVPTPPPPDPTGGFCGTVPHPHGPVPIVS
jgi:hypothetical protein